MLHSCGRKVNLIAYLPVKSLLYINFILTFVGCGLEACHSVSLLTVEFNITYGSKDLVSS